MNTTEFIAAALLEDMSANERSALASIPGDAQGRAILKVKGDGIIAGIALAQEIFYYLEPGTVFNLYKNDGDKVSNGEIAFVVAASVHTILKAERIVLNCIQRMSGIATITRLYVQAIKDYPAKILGTIRGTPLFRRQEEEAVRIGGGVNRNMDTYDRVILKGNHPDFSGGIRKAIAQTRAYLHANKLDLKIEVETRTIDDLRRVMSIDGVHRLILDNYSPEQITDAIKLLGGRYEIEASGSITIDNVVAYARTGVDYISVDAIMQHALSLNMSLKAQVL